MIPAGSSVAFRVDASRHIGSGHLVRCLTFANALRERGAKCQFIGRRADGDLHELLSAQGHEATHLPQDDGGFDWRADAHDTKSLLGPGRRAVLVCDHYMIDQRWESALRASCDTLMVIDDLANRPHDCDVLLDQNLGRSAEDYAGRVPAPCTILAGPAFALLRPQFNRSRATALARRERVDFALARILVSLGGADASNATGSVLAALGESRLPAHVEIDVVVGAASPWLDAIRQMANSTARRIHVHSNVNDMASLMLDADLAIGAGGTTSWERCCLALPTLLVVLADNQRPGAQALVASGAATLIGEQADIPRVLPALVELLNADPEQLRRMSRAAAAVTDGCGTDRVVAFLEQA
jgi:UDP-2,4-diacetamido-2,4,6-trideoxy-beta-L-altropyranose hydrolase